MTVKPAKLAYINAVRGIAILMVITLHVSRAAIKSISPTFAYICAKGSYGVQLFFVASALTLFISYNNRSQKEGTETNRNFFLRRFFRISPMYYLAALTYGAIFYFLPRYNDGKPLVLWKMLANLFYVNGVLPGAINYVPPGGWSVGVEMLFYLCLPFLFVRIKNHKAAITWFVLLAAASVVLKLVIRYVLIAHGINYQNPETWFLYFWFPNQFPVFFLGFILYFVLQQISVSSKFKTYTLFTLSTIAMALISYFMPVIDPHSFMPEHIIVAIFFSINIFLLAQHPFIIFNNRITRFLGEISFSLYLVHFMVVYLLADYCPLPGTPYPKFATLLFLTLAISAAISTLTYRFVEQKGIRFGNKFTRVNPANIKLYPVSTSSGLEINKDELPGLSADLIHNEEMEETEVLPDKEY